MKLPYILVYAAALASCVQSCEDNEDFHFYQLKNGILFTRKCEWLTSSGEATNADRISKFCSKLSNGYLIQEECPVSCNFCTKPTNSPTKTIIITDPPTIDPDACVDSPTFTFETINNGKAKQRRCPWLTSSSEATAIRLIKWCRSVTTSGDVVGNKCKASCGTCPTVSPSIGPSSSSTESPSIGPSLSSTESPTKSPSPTPAPIVVPSASPSTAPCVDNPDYRWVGVNLGIERGRTCSWLTKDPFQASFRTNKHCRIEYEGVLVRDECRESCNNCPTHAPSPAPSPKATDPPTASPTTPPTTASPTAVASPTPTTGPSVCSDSSTYKFFNVKNGVQINRRCAWLAGDTTGIRQAKFCSETINGSLVADECRVTCNNCPSDFSSPTGPPVAKTPPTPPTSSPTSSPTIDSCPDSSTFFFYQTKNGVQIVRKCAWLTTPVRITKFCSKTQHGSLIQDECKKSCGKCPGDDDSSSGSIGKAPTSPIPSEAPTVQPSLSCSDSTTFVFFQVKYGHPLERKCSYLTSSPSNTADRIAKFCPMTVDGVMVKDACALSCNNCPTPGPSVLSTAPSSNPTIMISAKPSVSASPTLPTVSEVPSVSPTIKTDLPSLLPSISSKPSVKPSALPSASPSISSAPTVCVDSTTYFFYSTKDNRQISRKCGWLEQDSAKETERKAKFCTQEHNGYKVRDQCRKSCFACP